jgi:hypothetical protein
LADARQQVCCARQIDRFVQQRGLRERAQDLDLRIEFALHECGDAVGALARGLLHCALLLAKRHDTERQGENNKWQESCHPEGAASAGSSSILASAVTAQPTEWFGTA